MACRTLPGRTSEWGRYESAPVTEGAVLHNGAGGRAFAAIWALRFVGCRAASRASGSARSVMYPHHTTCREWLITRRRVQFSAAQSPPCA
jgi:hypothetical protein